MTDDELWPRDLDHRYRLYAVRGSEREVLAAAPTAGGIGEAIVALHQDLKLVSRSLSDSGVIGILDTCPDGQPSPRGEWIVTPYPRSSP